MSSSVEFANVKLSSPSPTELTIELIKDGNPATEVVFSTAEIDSIISSLSQFRRSMTPNVPAERPTSSLEGTVVDPGIQILTVSPDQGQTEPRQLLSLRHPGMGWLSFLLSRAVSASVGHALLGTPQPPPGPPIPNRRLH